jgi:hypothetical protein
VPAAARTRLERRPADEVKTQRRQRPANVHAAIIVERDFKNLRLEAEAVTEFAYQPVACAQPYQPVVKAPPAFGRRCIPADCVAPPSHMLIFSTVLVLESFPSSQNRAALNTCAPTSGRTGLRLFVPLCPTEQERSS